MAATFWKAWSATARSYCLKVSPRGQGLSPAERTKVESSRFLRLEYLALKFFIAATIGVTHCSRVHVSQWLESTTRITRSGLAAFMVHGEEGLLPQMLFLGSAHRL